MCLFNMRIVQSEVLAVGLALALAGVSASAAIETQVIDYGSAAAPVAGGTIDLSYNEFNPSLGELTGITILLDSYDAAKSEVFSISGAGTAYRDASVSDGSETVNALGLSTSTRHLSSGPFDGTTTGFLTIAGSGHAQHQRATEHIHAAGFSSFIGIGSEEFAVSIVPGTGRFSGHGPDSLGFGGIFDSYGTIQIDYTYIPAIAVPEAPYFSFVAGGGAGFVALGGLVRHFRRSKA